MVFGMREMALLISFLHWKTRCATVRSTKDMLIVVLEVRNSTRFTLACSVYRCLYVETGD